MCVRRSPESPARTDPGTKGNVWQLRVWARHHDWEAERTATVKLWYELLMNKAAYKTSPAQIHFA